MTPIKDEVIALLNRLAEDASLEDIQYHLYVIEKVRNGLDSIEKERGANAETSGREVEQMAHLLIWSRRASEDLAEIAAYIAQDSEVYSTSVVRTILRKASTLSEFPMIGRMVPEFDDPSIREIFAYSYRIIY